MATGKARGIGNMGETRRPPPLRFFVELYRKEIAFQALVDFVLLGTLTIAFLHPQQLLHPFSGKSSTTAPKPQVAAPSTPPAPVAPPPAAAPAAGNSPSRCQSIT